jgi:hypothetical protein
MLPNFKASKSNVLENFSIANRLTKYRYNKIWSNVLLLSMAPALIVLRIRIFHLASGGLPNPGPEKVTYNP